MGQTISEKKVEKQGVPKKGQKQAHRTVPQEGKDNEPQIVDRDLREDPKHLTTAQRESRIANVRYESAAQQSTVKDSRTLQELSSHNEIHSTNATGRRCSQYWEASQPCDHVSKIAALEQEIAVLQQSAHRNMLQFKLYDRKIEKLNDIILNQSAKHEQDDDKIIEDSQAIRREIEGIILKNYVITSLDREVQAYETSAKQNWPQELFDSFLNASSYGRLYLIRSYVFKQINHDIFNGTLFGLDGDMEKQMQEFEKVIMASKHVDHSEAIEWRRRTVSYVLLLTPKTENRASRVAESLQKLLAPLYFTRTNEYGKAKLDRLLFEDLLNLCNMAINLALRFRASPSEYRFQTDFRGCDQALVEDMGYEGICPNPDDHTKHIIFCTLFGALVKKQFSPLGDGRLNILEKGHVIVKV